MSNTAQETQEILPRTTPNISHAQNDARYVARGDELSKIRDMEFS